MKMHTIWVIFLLCTTVLAQEISYRTAQDRPMPKFEYAEGWLGADDAYSIPIPSTNRSIWLLGDTFVAGAPGSLQRREDLMPRNSVGISDCPANGECTLRYYWQKKGPPSHAHFSTPGLTTYGIGRWTAIFKDTLCI